MSKKASRRFLFAAFMLSIVLHLAGGRFLHWPQARPQEAIERVSLSKRLVLHSLPVSRPSPHAAVRPAGPKPARLALSLPHLQVAAAPHPGKGATGPPAGVATARPLRPIALPSQHSPAAVAPSPSAAPAFAGCLKPNQPVAIVEKVLPLISKRAREAGTHGIARVHVKISADAAVSDVQLTDSSQNHELDLEALNAARTSTYSPAISNCKPVAGETDYAVEFVPF